MKYLCIYNQDLLEIRYAEQWPDDTEEDKSWLEKNIKRLELTCYILKPEVWKFYMENEPLAWVDG